MRAGGGAAVGVVTKGVDVHATLGIGIMASDVPGDGSGTVLGLLLEDNGAGDLGVTTDDSNYTSPVLATACPGTKAPLHRAAPAGSSQPSSQGFENPSGQIKCPSRLSDLAQLGWTDSSGGRGVCRRWGKSVQTQKLHTSLDHFDGFVSKVGGLLEVE